MFPAAVPRDVSARPDPPTISQWSESCMPAYLRQHVRGNSVLGRCTRITGMGQWRVPTSGTHGGPPHFAWFSSGVATRATGSSTMWDSSTDKHRHVVGDPDFGGGTLGPIASRYEPYRAFLQTSEATRSLAHSHQRSSPRSASEQLSGQPCPNPIHRREPTSRMEHDRTALPRLRG